MKHDIASLAIGTCLLLSSTGAVFAGQPGTSAGNNCGLTSTSGVPATSFPGGSVNTPNPVGPNGQVGGSPFSADVNNLVKGYAGNSTNPGNETNPKAVSQYDIACVNVTTKSSQPPHPH
jgi:hypothetical protein